jgi:cation-transporting ATPase 13A3/4/5
MDSTGSQRRGLSRRSSEDSQVSRQNTDIEQDSDNDELSSSETRLKRTSTPPSRPGVFDNIASLFTRTPQATDPPRRRLLSQHSSGSVGRYSRRSRRSDAGSEHALDVDDDDSQERWGYSSGEEDSSDADESDSGRSISTNMSVPASMQYDSEPPSPTSQGIPLLASDQIFGGEARIDMGISFALLDAPPPGPPSRQTLYIPDEDNTIRFVGYETIWWRRWLWIFCCIITLGALSLLGHWFPQLWLRWVAREKAFQDATDGFVVVEV